MTRPKDPISRPRPRLARRQLDVLDSQGRSVLLTDTSAASRRLLQSLPERTVIEG